MLQASLQPPPPLNTFALPTTFEMKIELSLLVLFYFLFGENCQKIHFVIGENLKVALSKIGEWDMRAGIRDWPFYGAGVRD